MFLRVVAAEYLKEKHSPVWLAFLILPLIPAVLGTANYSINTDLLTGQWEDLWTQHTLFNCYFFLHLIGHLCCMALAFGASAA